MNFKLSNWQIFWLYFSFEIGMALLLTISPTVKLAKQDVWMCTLLGTAGAIGLAWVAVQLGRLHPNLTIVEASQTILGKWFGRLIMVPFLFMWYMVTGLVLRQFTDFAHLALFDRTPMWALIVPFLALAAYAAYTGGIEGIGRSSEIIGPIVLVVICIIFVLNIPNIRFFRMLPLYGDASPGGMFQGTLVYLSFFGEVVSFVSMIVPFSTSPQKLWGIIVKSILLTGGATTVTVWATIVMFGPDLTEKMLYPAYEAVRYVSSLEFIQNIDSTVVIVWFFTYFVKVAFYFFVSSFATTQWLGIKNTQPVNWIVSVVVSVISLAPSYLFANFSFPHYWLRLVLPVNFVCIPIFLLIVGIIRKKRSSPQPKAA